MDRYCRGSVLKLAFGERTIVCLCHNVKLALVIQRSTRKGAVPTAELIGYNGKDHAALTYAAGPMET
jgi:hypothetical protein